MPSSDLYQSVPLVEKLGANDDRNMLATDPVYPNGPCDPVYPLDPVYPPAGPCYPVYPKSPLDPVYPTGPKYPLAEISTHWVESPSFVQTSSIP